MTPLIQARRKQEMGLPLTVDEQLTLALFEARCIAEGKRASGLPLTVDEQLTLAADEMRDRVGEIAARLKKSRHAIQKGDPKQKGQKGHAAHLMEKLLLGDNVFTDPFKAELHDAVAQLFGALGFWLAPSADCAAVLAACRPLRLFFADAAHVEAARLAFFTGRGRKHKWKRKTEAAATKARLEKLK